MSGELGNSPQLSSGCTSSRGSVLSPSSLALVIVSLPLAASQTEVPDLWFQNRVSPFKDMIFCFSEEDWSLLDPAQTGFYGEFIIGEDCGVSLPPSKTSLPLS